MANPTLNNHQTESDSTRTLLELLYQVSRELATAIDLRTVLQRVLFAAIENVGGERGTIVVLDDDGKAMDSTIVYGQRVRQDTTLQIRDTVEHGLAGWVVRNRKPAVISDTHKDERWIMRPGTGSLAPGKSALCVPLLAREKLVGVLTLVHSKPNSFGDEHLELMQAIADQAGIAVLNARLYTESQRQARVMGALVDSATAINTSLRLDDVLQRILNQTIQALQVETVALALIEASSKELVFRAATGLNAGNILNWHIPLGQGLAGTVVLNGFGEVVSNASEDIRFKGVDGFGGIEIRAIVLSPILAQGKVIGVLEAINPVAGVFDPDALIVLNGLGSLAGTTIQNAQLFEKLNTAHQHYRELFEDSIDPILLTNRDGIILESNRQAFALSGYDNESLRGMEISKLHNIDNIDFKGLRAYQTNTFDSELKASYGRSIPVQVSIRPVEYQESDALQWIIRDVSERKALDDLRNDLTAMIYHDLRSPLANIISSLDILSGIVDTNNNETAHSLMTIAVHSTTRIERLINSLLDINRLESGQDITKQEVISLDELLKQVILELEPALKSRQQSLKISIQGTLPKVWVDKDMLLRILVNLLENATKFTPTEGLITAGATVEGDWLKVFVKDTGPGIPEGEQKRIFDKFTRLRGVQKIGGLGIGLAFCRLAVEGHGGRIWVESENGEGTTFFFTLPIATDAQLATVQGE